MRSGTRLQKCIDCGLVFLEEWHNEINDRFFDDSIEIKTKYSDNKDKIEYWSYPENYTKYKDVFHRFFEERLKNIIKVNPNINSLLDIGSGYGFFLDYIREKIPNVSGLELDPDVMKYARDKLGLNVMSERIEYFESSERFDCITMCDVLEHLIDPVAVLERCWNLLSSGGVIFIQVPNLVGFKLPFGHGWGLPHHIWQFGPRSLIKLVENCGFSVHHWYTGVLGVIGVYKREGPTLLDSFIWATARRFKIGNRLMLVAIKK